MEQISARQLNLIAAIFVYAISLVYLPATLVRTARHDAWMAVFPGLAVMLGVLWIMARIAGRFPGKDLFTAMVERFPILGRVIALCYVAFFFVTFARDIRTITAFTYITLLPTTPIWVIAVLIAGTAGLIARGGIEVVARMTELFGPSLIVITLALPVLTLNALEFRHLAPLLEWGLGPPLEAGLQAGAWIGEAALLPLLFGGHTFRFRDAAYGMVAGTLLLWIATATYLLLLGPDLGTRPLFPSWEAVRHIHLTDFLDRWDLVLVGIWFPPGLIKVSYGLYAVVHGLGRMSKSIDPRLMSSAGAALGLTCAMWFFDSAQDVRNLNRAWPFLAVWFEVAIPLLLLVILRPKKADLTLNS